jgi:DNA invertase Pin-like site-specific DNA recombinase
MRCAAYARYSTDRQSPLSIEDQLRKCREFAERQGWGFLEGYIFTDEAISGATDVRSGLREMLDAACSPERPFDVVLVDDTSRLSRRIADSLRIFEQLSFVGVRLVFISQGIDTGTEQAEILMATHGIVDSLYIKELAKKTHRGMEGVAIRGLHTGGRCFGYASNPIVDPTTSDQYGRPKIVGTRLEIEPEQAETVRRIFREYASGLSLRAIARGLNADGVMSPMPYRGQRRPSWSPGCLSVMLRNERYRGVVVWNRTRKIRDPRTGKRIHRERPRSDWKIREAWELRIIPEEVWEAVQRRAAVVQSNFRKGLPKGLCSRSFASRYFLSGFLKCGICGSALTIVSGRGMSSWGRYGCPVHVERGACSNGMRLRRVDIEREVLSGLQREIFNDDVIQFAIGEFEKQLRERIGSLRSDVERKLQRRDVLRVQIDNLADAVAQGYASEALFENLTRRERELKELNNALLPNCEEGIQVKLDRIEKFIRARFADLRQLSSENAIAAKAELGKHCDSIWVTPDDDGYTLSGEWKLTAGRSDGAGGPVRTGRVFPFTVPLAMSAHA